jgi:SAM-dependent methyltransferase
VTEPDEEPRILRRPAEFARVFDRIPNDYEARPPYPAELFELLVDSCGLGAGSRVLEVGAGTGQATLPLLDLGASVTAIEPGPALAGRLAERTTDRDITIIIADLEVAPVAEASFDLVASATAFHWVDPVVGPAKCGRALRDDGWLALWWTVWGDSDRADPFHNALRPLLEAKAPQLVGRETTTQAYASDLAARAGEVERTGMFGPVRHEIFRWDGVHDPVGLRRLFATFAPWLALPDPLRQELLDDVERIARDEFGGTVRRPYQTVVYLAPRLPR